MTMRMAIPRWGTTGILAFGFIILPTALPPDAIAAPGKCEAPILLDQLCEAGRTVAGKAGEVVTAPFRAAAGGVVDTITTWVAEGAQWLLGKVVRFIDNSTSPDLGVGWFAERYEFMVGLGALVLVPMLLMASIRAVMTQDLGQLGRSFFVYLPLSILGTFMAVFLTQTFLTVTDALSAAVAEGIAGDVSEIFDAVGDGLGLGGVTGPVAPSFAIFFGALLLIIGSFFVWLELLVRSAAVTVSVFFLPMILASLVWPATAHWTRRLVEALVALILSKFVIVAVISLATAALADPGGGGFGSVMGGAALMLMAAFSPMALLKLIPLAQGAGMSHLEGLGRRPIQSARPGGGANQALSIMRSKVGGRSPSSQMAVTASRVPVPAVAGGAVSMGAGSVARSAAKPTREVSSDVSDETRSQASREGVGGKVAPNSGQSSGTVKPPKRPDGGGRRG